MTARHVGVVAGAAALALLGGGRARAGAAAAVGDPLADVRRPLADDVVVNWTLERVEVTASAYDPNLATDNKPLEQRAIGAIDQRLPSALASVPIRPGQTLGALDVAVPAPTLQGWSIVEGRYFTSGRVDVVGALELREVLATWSQERAVTRPEGLDTAVTGALIDVRGLGVEPSWSPVLAAADGRVVFDGTLWKDAAWEHAPVVWVGDPAHPRAGAAGRTPAYFVAAGVVDGAIVLSNDDASRFADGIGHSLAVGEGAVVLVVEP
ncbi:MAG: hypothetical protein H6733_05535 [Alphaproteobacteria bacterium]|nr:hypothetical protein [Alphaproteobacteria bacterium]